MRLAAAAARREERAHDVPKDSPANGTSAADSQLMSGS